VRFVAGGFRNLALLVVVKEPWLSNNRFLLLLEITRFVTEKLPNLSTAFDLGAVKVLHMERGFRQVVEGFERRISLNIFLYPLNEFHDLVADAAKGQQYRQEQNGSSSFAHDYFTNFNAKVPLFREAVKYSARKLLWNLRNLADLFGITQLDLLQLTTCLAFLAAAPRSL
jgi:hypothetical protein